MKRYNNYHKHDHISSIITPDSNTKPIEYIERCKEIGEINYWTTNHGTGGDVFEAVKLCQANGINCKFGLEGYIVPDPLEKDARNYHIIVLPKTNIARKKLNLASSKAHMEGYYYKPRLFLSDLLNNFDRDELFITTACMGGIIRDKDAIEYIFKPLYDKFKKNLLLEVQNHKHIAQIKINKRVQELAKMYNLDIVYANDSHYIYPHQAVERQIMLKGKGLNYGEEDDFILDYPDYDEAFKRCKEQGVLSDLEIDLALYNTLRFDECENIILDKSIKMPTIYPDKTENEKIEILKGLLNKNFKDLRKHNELDESKIKQYKDEIHKEMKVIEDTSEVHSADYFLMNDKILNLAINKYGGTLTRSGRGSAGSELINRILGITQIDRLQYKLPLYSERFMSTARLLENKSMPDIDFNVTDQEPFVKASKELLGEHGVYPMVAYGTMQESEAFRNYCRSLNLPYDEYNEVAKNLDKYRNDKKWAKHIEKCQQYVGTIISKSIHPCSYCLYDGDLREEIGVIKAGDNYCVMITSEESDDWKYLKDDFLVVSVWDIIKQTFEEIGSHIISVPELLRRIDDEVWGTIGNGITATLNQLDGDYTTSLVKRYKPRNVEELAMFVACIRPSFASFREKFINRESYTTGSDKLDEVLANTNHYILFQENLMQFFQWLGVTPSESIGLIKKISKKKIKPDDFEHLTKKLLKNWIKKTGSEEGFDTIWADMQAAMGYGFNCVSGDTKIFRAKNNNEALSVEQMYMIRTYRKYAQSVDSLSLYSKYRSNGYGKTLSLFDDMRLRTNNIVNIDYAGVRQIYKVVTQSGRVIKCTINHSFPTPNGKKELKDLKVGDCLYYKGDYIKRKYDYRLSDSVGIRNIPKKGQQGFQTLEKAPSKLYKMTRKKCVEERKPCECCNKEYSSLERFELHHKDGNSQNNTLDNYEWLCCSCHKKSHYNMGRTKQYQNGIDVITDEIISIEKLGFESIYDVSMAHPHHNFALDNGLITSNSPHGLSYAIDCLYCAYLKTKFPLEYYTVVLNLYAKDEERTKKLIKELAYFDIKISSIKFRFSQADYSFNKDTRTIYKGINSVKYLNKRISKELYNLRNNKYDTFVDLLIDINEKTSVNSAQLDILIKLDFFSEFGDIHFLEEVNNIYNTYADRKQIAIQEDLEYEDIIERCSEKKTEKQYRGIDGLKLVKDIIEHKQERHLIPKTTIVDKIKYENEKLGYVSMTIPDLEETIALVMEVNGKFATKLVKLYRLKTGEIEFVKVKGKVFDSNPIYEGDIIKTILSAEEKKWKRNSDGTFYQIDERETILKKWNKVEIEI